MKKIDRCCPKCRALPKDVEVLFVDGAYYAKCKKCGTYTDIYSRWADSVDAWNKRKV